LMGASSYKPPAGKSRGDVDEPGDSTMLLLPYARSGRTGLVAFSMKSGKGLFSWYSSVVPRWDVAALCLRLPPNLLRI